ncbi:hypothetical protein HDU98_011441 [Podochytrium sp. JEL0797]|nr:hypothetical protein HDU98_011441 [Podochytrium sp. JEL0797]
MATMPRPDAHEIVETEWFTPEEALAAFKAHRIQLIPPQFVTLTELKRYTFQDVCALVRGDVIRAKPFECRPEPFVCDEDGGVLLLPGDVSHSDTERMRKEGGLEGVMGGSKNRLKFEFSDKVVSSIGVIVTGGNTAMGAVKGPLSKL